MRVGYFNDYRDVIQWSTVSALCPVEAKALEKVLETQDFNSDLRPLAELLQPDGR